MKNGRKSPPVFMLLDIPENPRGTINPVEIRARKKRAAGNGCHLPPEICFYCVISAADPKDFLQVQPARLLCAAAHR